MPGRSIASTISRVVFCLLSGVGLANAAEDVSPRVEFRTEGAEVRVEVTGLSASVLDGLAERDLDREAWSRILAVSVAAEDDSAAPAMLGEYCLEEGRVVFNPRFPLRPGLTYRAVFHPAALPRGLAADGKTLTVEFALPAPAAAAPTAITAVYPTRDTLPENQLKFYLHFSAPMSRGEAYEHIHLLNDRGERVEHPFLELGEELWDPSGKRFTLFFDPGRIKRGLQPRELFGPALEEGGTYTLVVAKTWSDATGRPLQMSFRKKFKVTAPDDLQPDPRHWKLSAPAAGTREPLRVTFDEPLDHGMLQRVLVVRDSAGRVVAGEIEVDRQETRWRFRPERRWSAGGHQLTVETALEDLAGNSIGRPFEVDVARPIEKQIERRSVAVPFEVAVPR